MARRTKLAITAITLIFFAAAFLHASVWATVTPLWQIPDEPAHYEYVRLLVKLGRPPVKGDEDPQIQADILRSMWENHYWEYLGFKRPDHPPARILAGGWTSGEPMPDTAVVGDAFIYAFSNLSNSQPLYYLALAPVQWATLNLPVDEQLRALRLASRFIFALAVAFIVLTSMELFGSQWALVIGAGAVATLQPMFAYIGSGLNNDVGVICVMALLGWQVAAAWRRSFSWGRLGLIVITALAAIFTKRTAVFTLAWLPVIFAVRGLARLNPNTRRRVVIAGASAVAITALLSATLYFIPGPLPANWSSPTPWQQAWTTAAAHGGQRSFLLQANGAQEQAIQSGIKRPSGLPDGSAVIFSAWVRAPGASGALRLKDNTGQMAERRFSDVNDWQFMSVTLPLTTSTSTLTFMAAGLSATPLYVDDLHAEAGTLHAVTLNLPNPSAEEASPMLAQVVLSLARAVGVYGQAASMLRDYRANLAALPGQLGMALGFMNSSFWGKFGIFARAANPSLPAGWDTALGVLATLGMGAAGVQVIVRRREGSTPILVALFLIGFVLLLAQTLAPLLSFAALGVWLPQGRYLFAGMGLITCLLTYGWLSWLHGRWRWVGVAIWGLVLLVVGAAALLACRAFYI